MSCFAFFDGLVYFCLLYSFFIVAVFHHFSSFRHQGTCWWRYPRFQWLVDCLSYSWLLDAVCWIMFVMVSLMVSMASSFCSASHQFPNSSWNSIFFDPIWWPLGHQLFPFHLHVQLNVAHNHSVVTSMLTCSQFPSTVWAFPRPSPPCFLLKHSIVGRHS